MTEPQMPDEAFIVDEHGAPLGHVDMHKLIDDARRLMLDLAETAGDDDATDRVAERWVAALDPQYYSYVSTAALSLLVRNVLGPVLDAAEAAGLPLRAGLRRAATEARGDDGGPS